MNVDRPRPSAAQIVGQPQAALPIEHALERHRTDPFHDRLPFLREPSEVVKLALASPRTLHSERGGDRVVQWLPHSQVYRVMDARDGSSFSVTREAIQARGSVEGRARWITGLVDEINSLLGAETRPTPLDPLKPNGKRKIHRVADYISNHIGAPLAVKEVPRGYSLASSPLRNLDQQFLRMQTLRQLTKERLTSDQRNVIDICRVFAAFSRMEPDGSITQWMLMEEVVGGQMSIGGVDPRTFPGLAVAIEHSADRMIDWLDVEDFFEKRGIPLVDCGGRNILRAIGSDGQAKFTIIDQ